jgi:site-specific recombinase XerD
MAEDRALTTAGAGQLVPVAGQPLEQNPAAVYLARLAPGSRRTMRQALDAIAELATSGRCDALTMPWAQLRYQHTQAIRAALAERHKPGGANKMLSALRQVLKEAWRLGQMTAEDYQRAADLKSVRGESLPKGRALSEGEIVALFRACAADKTPAGARDAALLAVLYGSGLRRAEAVALDVTDFDVHSGALTVRKGKGDKARVTYAENGAATYLVDWSLARGPEPGPLFCPVDKSGRVILRRMTSQAVWNALAKRAEQAGVSRFTPHDLRRTFISELLDRTGDVSAVQKLAGHANVSTTLRYDRRPEAAKRKAAGLLHVPYFERD